MDTGRGASHTEVCCEGLGERQWEVGSWGGTTWGEMRDIGDGDGGSKSHCHMCTYATVLHVLYMYPRTQNAIIYIYEIKARNSGSHL